MHASIWRNHAKLISKWSLLLINFTIIAKEGNRRNHASFSNCNIIKVMLDFLPQQMLPMHILPLWRKLAFVLETNSTNSNLNIMIIDCEHLKRKFERETYSSAHDKDEAYPFNGCLRASRVDGMKFLRHLKFILIPRINQNYN